MAPPGPTGQGPPAWPDAWSEWAAGWLDGPDGGTNKLQVALAALKKLARAADAYVPRSRGEDGGSASRRFVEVGDLAYGVREALPGWASAALAELAPAVPPRWAVSSTAVDRLLEHLFTGVNYGDRAGGIGGKDRTAGSKEVTGALEKGCHYQVRRVAANRELFDKLRQLADAWPPPQRVAVGWFAVPVVSQLLKRLATKSETEWLTKNVLATAPYDPRSHDPDRDDEVIPLEAAAAEPGARPTEDAVFENLEYAHFLRLHPELEGWLGGQPATVIASELSAIAPGVTAEEVLVRVLRLCADPRWATLRELRDPFADVGSGPLLRRWLSAPGRLKLGTSANAWPAAQDVELAARCVLLARTPTKDDWVAVAAELGTFGKPRTAEATEKRWSRLVDENPCLEPLIAFGPNPGRLSELEELLAREEFWERITELGHGDRTVGQLMARLGPRGCAIVLDCRSRQRSPYTFAQVAALVNQEGFGEVDADQLEKLWLALMSLHILQPPSAPAR
jgi:hypothetical protein